MLPRHTVEDPEKQSSTNGVERREPAQSQDRYADEDPFKDELVSQEPDVEKWPLSKRIVFALVVASSLWAVIAVIIFLVARL